ncbi:MAG: protein YgfX [Pseudomonadota bacterium]
MSFDATLDLTPRPSIRALMMGSLLHLAVGAALPFAMEPGWPMGAIAALIGLSWVSLRRHPALGLGLRALTRLTWHTDGSWTLHEASGQKIEAELDGSSLVHSRWMVLNFKLRTGGRKTRILVGDELESDQMRRLRARLSASD